MAISSTSAIERMRPWTGAASGAGAGAIAGVERARLAALEPEVQVQEPVERALVRRKQAPELPGLEPGLVRPPTWPTLGDLLDDLTVARARCSLRHCPKRFAGAREDLIRRVPERLAMVEEGLSQSSDGLAPSLLLPPARILLGLGEVLVGDLQREWRVREQQFVLAMLVGLRLHPGRLVDLRQPTDSPDSNHPRNRFRRTGGNL